MNWLCEFLLTVRQRLCLLPRHVTRFFFQSDTWVSGELSRRIWIPLELAARCGYSHSIVTNSYQLTWNQPAVYSWVVGRMRWCNNDYRLTERSSKKNNIHIICQTHGNIRDCGSNSAHKKSLFQLKYLPPSQLVVQLCFVDRLFIQRCITATILSLLLTATSVTGSFKSQKTNQHDSQAFKLRWPVVDKQ